MEQGLKEKYALYTFWNHKDVPYAHEPIISIEWDARFYVAHGLRIREVFDNGFIISGTGRDGPLIDGLPFAKGRKVRLMVTFEEADRVLVPAWPMERVSVEYSGIIHIIDDDRIDKPMEEGADYYHPSETER